MNARSPYRLGMLAILASLLLTAPQALAAQDRGRAATDDTTRFVLDPLTITATRTATLVFDAPAPVYVLNRRAFLESQPSTITDLLRTLPGLDVTGVGVQQPRPIIRGQRGQRILLLQDGMRLNNSRRQQDFGEIPALVDVSAVDRVEVVRGPSSVLYGTDAIGGVVNVITQIPEQEGLHGSFGYRYASAGGLDRVMGRATGRFGPWDLQIGASVRDAGAYEAPDGSFGEIDLADEVTVDDTGVEDRSFDARVGYRISGAHRLFVRGEGYDAEGAGFGVVDPQAFSDDPSLIRITFPEQDFGKVSLGYQGSGLGLAILDDLEATAYFQRNDRLLRFQVDAPAGPPPAMISVDQHSDTELSTFGFRLEAKRGLGRARLTYGVDGFFDDSENTDSTRTVMSGFGPGPDIVVDDTDPSVPNATYRSVGAFAQAELGFGDRTDLVAGLRLQSVRAETEETEGVDLPAVDRSEATLVGSLSAIVDLTDDLSLVGSVGRGFRAPNLVELFFDGRTPEGQGFQERNPDLEAETSLNVDLGLRLQVNRFRGELFVFRNRVDEGIRIEDTGRETESGTPIFRNVNIDELTYRGVELAGDLSLVSGFSLQGGASWLDVDLPLDENNPVGENASSKLFATLRWDRSPGWAEYTIRHNGEQDDVRLTQNPVGTTIPGFTVHSIRAGALLPAFGGLHNRVVVEVANLTDELYSETSNASFFRPEPKRNLTLTWEVVF